jgi:hypothetical protein
MPWRSRFMPAFPRDRLCGDLDDGLRLHIESAEEFVQRGLVSDEGVGSTRLAGASFSQQSQ